METNGWLYDGAHAARYDLRADADGDALRLRFGDGQEMAVPADELVHVESQTDREIYGRMDIQGWRLSLTRPLPEAILPLLPSPQKYGRWIDRVGLARAAALFLVLSGLVLFVGNRFPAWAAPYVPPAWEERYGDTLVGDFGGKFCGGAEGEKALKKLVDRVAPGSRHMNVRIVDLPVVNAAALPGGNIVIFDELLKEAQSPEEAAGVLAHEMAHIEKRHVTQAMIRELGLGLIVSAFGGNVGGNVNALLAARYSRDMEREADGGAIAILARADISPAPTAAFFERLAKREGQLGRFGEGLAYLSSHPLSKERQQKFRGAAVPGHRYPPLLTAKEWQALAGICGSGPAEEGATS